jgi:hypothetical protein
VIEVIALEQKRLAGGFRQGIRKAVSEIQRRSMPAALSEIAVRFPCEASLIFGDRLDDNLSFPEEIVKTSARNRAPAAINHHPSFDVADG